MRIPANGNLAKRQVAGDRRQGEVHWPSYPRPSAFICGFVCSVPSVPSVAERPLSRYSRGKMVGIAHPTAVARIM